MSNFAFLQTYWPDFAKTMEFAEKYVYTDPASSKNKSGLFVELMVREILRIEKLADGAKLSRTRIVNRTEFSDAFGKLVLKRLGNATFLVVVKDVGFFRSEDGSYIRSRPDPLRLERRAVGREPFLILQFARKEEFLLLNVLIKRINVAANVVMTFNGFNAPQLLDDLRRSLKITSSRYEITSAPRLDLIVILVLAIEEKL